MSDKPTTYKVELTSDEIRLLDGHCRPEIQIVVDLARAAVAFTANTGLPENMAKMVARIIDEAATKGKLTYVSVSIKRCPCCNRSDGYYLTSRATKYRRKGVPDYDHPKTFTGYDVARGFVVTKDSVTLGFCTTCADQVRPVLAERLNTVKAQIPESILGEPCRWKYNENRRCTKCGWEGHEGEMGRERTLIGDGTYPAKCPKCGATNQLFDHPVANRDGFTLTEVAAKVETSAAKAAPARRVIPEVPLDDFGDEDDT